MNCQKAPRFSITALALAAVPLTMDLERVEVLKGPQGILFGKNTIGGAINITTAKPSFENEGMVDALYSDDHGEQIYNVMLNGGITDKIAGRLAVRYDGMDGWWDNKLLKTQGPDSDNWYGRAGLLVDASESLEILVKYEYGDFQTDDPAQVVYQSDQPLNFLGEDVFPIIDDQDKAAFDLSNGTEVRTDVGVITLNWDVDFATFTSISAYSKYDKKAVTNSDFSATESLHRTLDEDFEQWSQELRLVSPGGETIDWIVGGYYEHAELNVSRVTTATDFALSGPLTVLPLVALPDSVPVPGNFDQDTDAYAAFAQLTYNLTDTVRVTGGLRFNHEEKDLDKDFTSQAGARASTTGPAANVIVRARPGDGAIISDLRSHDWQGRDRDKDKWTWSFNAQWDATDNAMLYASVSTGFKSGGFDEAYSGAGDFVRLSDDIFTGEPNGEVIPGADPSILDYTDETVLAYELGAKMGLLDGAAELNIAVFRSEYDDLQTSSLIGDVFRVGNAGEAITHNGNMSNGLMFPMAERLRGKKVDRNYVKLRARWEPVYEVTQIKGDGEAHPLLSPDDAFADYETWDQGNMAGVPKTPDMLPQEYARSGLRNGLQLAAQFGVNPYEFGMIGSTDSHTSLAAVEENNFFGKHSGVEPTPERWNHLVGKAAKKLVKGWQQASSGYAAVWATENTREALFDAIQRREVYATTGPRMTVRLFGGWNFTAADALVPDMAEPGYARGVPMGGALSGPDGNSPSFLVSASKDSIGANLDRLQIVKGWLDAKGKTHEKVYDVAWSGQRTPDQHGVLPDVGNTVELSVFSDVFGQRYGISPWLWQNHSRRRANSPGYTRSDWCRLAPGC